jgi:hypothetical protein
LNPNAEPGVTTVVVLVPFVHSRTPLEERRRKFPRDRKLIYL